jgi:hypothetical protein
MRQAKPFCLKALEPLGVVAGSKGEPSYAVELCGKSDSSLCLYQAKEKPAPLHIAFVAATRRQVEAFYRAALAAGGKDNGAPGLPPKLSRKLLRGLRHWPGWAQHRGGMPCATTMSGPPTYSRLAFADTHARRARPNNSFKPAYPAQAGH